MDLRATAAGLSDLPDGQITDLPVQPPSKKYFCFSETQISAISVAIPASLEGRIAIVTDVGLGMRWTRQRRKTGGAFADG
jgi:hypothetical protein